MSIFSGGYMADGGNIKCHQCKKDMFDQCIVSYGEQYPPCVVVENCHSAQQLKQAISLLMRCYPLLAGTGVLNDVRDFLKETACV
jgi:hypothetical protein